MINKHLHNDEHDMLHVRTREQKQNSIRLAEAHKCFFIIFFSMLIITTFSCGKKGPPLPPLPNIPAQPIDWGIHVFDNEWWIWVIPPEANIDGTKPPDIRWLCVSTKQENFSWKSCQSVWKAQRRKTTDNRWFFRWRRQKPGCYILGLFNKRKKSAGPAAKRCISEWTPAQPAFVMGHLRTEEHSIHIFLQSPHSRFAVYRKVEPSKNIQPQTPSPLTNYTFRTEINHIFSTGFVSWRDTQVQHGERYTYLIRPLYVSGDKVRIEGPSYVFPSILYLDTFPPPSPAKGTIERAGELVLLTWESVKSDDLAGYRIYIQTSKGWHQLSELRPTMTQYTFSLAELSSIPEIVQPLTFRITSFDTIKPPNESKGLLLKLNGGKP